MNKNIIKEYFYTKTPEWLLKKYNIVRDYTEKPN